MILRFLAAATLLLTLPACAMNIGDDQVFMPPSLDSARTGMAFEGEETLATEFDATVTHEIVEFGNTPIAVSRVSAPGSASAPLIVSCPGNAADRPRTGTDYASKILPFGEAVIFDYPGYGDSGGTPTATNISRIGKPFMDWAAAQAGSRPLILWGHSLGGFVCAEFASRSDAVDAVILETTARNVGEVGRAWKPWWAPVRLRPTDDLAAYDTADALADFSGPVLILGAGRDGVLPVELHRSLAAALPRATYLELEGATHYSAGFDPRTVAAITELVDSLP